MLISVKTKSPTEVGLLGLYWLAVSVKKPQKTILRNPKITLERKIFLQVIQFVDQVPVNTRSSILTVCKANLCSACQGQQIFAFS